jgi:CheY-like chemotaxis protein
MAGREVLVSIKEDESLKTIPTVILTTVAERADIAMSYLLQANAYLVTPVQLDAFDALVQSISDFWATQVQRPPEPR